ncbi:MULTISPECIES: histidine kinase [unclassified Kribbella]|uniref:sensor histidine kinase n=1 Tax=unclassified Kribbella TaxID=2644121 RepID=UPI0033FA7737
MPTRPVLVLTTAALLVAIGAAIALAAAGGTDPLHAALILWIATSYAGSGLIAWTRRPANRFGPLMIVTGFGVLASTLIWSSAALPHTIGQALDLVPLVLVVHVSLAFPAGRLRHGYERVLVGTGYVFALGVQLLVMLLGGPGGGHLLTIADVPEVAGPLHAIELLVISGVALTGVGLLIARRRADGRPLRRSLALLDDAFMLGLLMIAVLLVVGVFEGPAFPAVRSVSLALIGLAPLAYLGGLLQARLARTAVGDLVLALRADPLDLRGPLAHALRDPSVDLVYWLPQFGSWADQDGRPVDLPADPDRVTMIERDGMRVAALLHHPALNEEPDLLDAVSAAAAIAIETGRLQAELRANVDELRGSRARVLEAGQQERRRLERNLHDGAQQRLVSLSLDLGVLETRLGSDPAAKALLSQARKEIAVSLDELRDVARGLYPAVLTAHGLAVALESLAARAPVPVELKVELVERLPEAVEVAAYYVVSESLTNIGKHAQARTASVDVHVAGGVLVVEVVDDGIGGADTERGSGLRGLADRVESLGGRLRIWTPRGAGTRLRAELPCG